MFTPTAHMAVGNNTVPLEAERRTDLWQIKHSQDPHASMAQSQPPRTHVTAVASSLSEQGKFAILFREEEEGTSFVLGMNVLQISVKSIWFLPFPHFFSLFFCLSHASWLTQQHTNGTLLEPSLKTRCSPPHLLLLGLMLTKAVDKSTVLSLTPLQPGQRPLPVGCNLTTPVQWQSFPLCREGSRM